jgi:hypothetical protein
MIRHGNLKSKRDDLNGKPYTLDWDNDFLHVKVQERPIAFSDYFPVSNVPNEYLIIDFDRDGRVVGYGFEGIIARWASRSLQNRFRASFVRAVLGFKDVSVASHVVSDSVARFIDSAVPKTDSAGRLPTYA